MCRARESTEAGVKSDSEGSGVTGGARRGQREFCLEKIKIF
jgi:hypothetical protein